VHICTSLDAMVHKLNVKPLQKSAENVMQRLVYVSSLPTQAVCKVFELLKSSFWKKDNMTLFQYSRWQYKFHAYIQKRIAPDTSDLRKQLFYTVKILKIICLRRVDPCTGPASKRIWRFTGCMHFSCTYPMKRMQPMKHYICLRQALPIDTLSLGI